MDAVGSDGSEGEDIVPVAMMVAAAVAVERQVQSDDVELRGERLPMILLRLKLLNREFRVL